MQLSTAFRIDIAVRDLTMYGHNLVGNYVIARDRRELPEKDYWSRQVDVKAAP